ncbi:MAG: DUF6754 domain-containing protein [Candidatus Eiseniibacteriota bacterium]
MLNLASGGLVRCAWFPPVMLACVGAVAAQTETPVVPPPAPPDRVVVTDVPNDGGTALQISWEPSPDAGRPGVMEGYRILRAGAGGDLAEVGSTAPAATTFRDTSLDAGTFVYRVVAFGPGGDGESAESAAASPRANWFNRSRGNILVVMLLVCTAIIVYIERARAGQKMYIRKIAGMDAVTEAVGRATEMGAPVLYISGIQDMDDVQTVAGITILGSISRMIAEYETTLLMPTSRSLVMSTARETVKEAYLSAGRPDAYRDDSIYYVTDEQFGFVAHVDGLMLRKRPAACFYLGAFFAESLILAETGNSIGAIQVAGTAQPTQLPFFVAACDYTLIGEELFAASAYLSQDEKMLGSLKGQDFGKLIAMVFIAVGAVFATLGSVTDAAPIAWVNEHLYELWSGTSE